MMKLIFKLLKVMNYVDSATPRVIFATLNSFLVTAQAVDWVSLSHPPFPGPQPTSFHGLSANYNISTSPLSPPPMDDAYQSQ